MLYVLGCTAVRDFCQPLGVSAYKSGLSSRRNPVDRILEARRVEYAGVVADLDCRNVTIRKHPAAREWFLTPLTNADDDPQITAGIAGLPFGAIRDGVIAFRLPAGIDLASLEQRYQLLLRPRNLNEFLGSPDGRERLLQVGLPPKARLFTDYTLMGAPRRSLVSELFCIRPRRETAILILALTEAIRIERALIRRIAAA
jgi:hypothetical protein